MFELQIHNVGDKKKTLDPLALLKNIIENLQDIVEDAEIKVCEKGLSMQIMDSMHAIVIDVFLSKDMFDSYRCDRNLTLGVKLKVLNNLLKNVRIEQDGMLEMLCEDNAKSLSIRFDSEWNKTTYNLTLYNFDIELYEFPHLEFSVQCKMPTEYFVRLPKVGCALSDFLVISAKKNEFILTQVSEYASSDIAIKNSSAITINVESELKVEIATKYINLLAKVSVMATNMRLCIGEDTPVFAEIFYMNLGHMRFYIAPKYEQ